MSNLIEDLSESLVDEIVTTVGLSKSKFNHWFFGTIFKNITDCFAELGASFDEITRKSGLPAASDWALKKFCRNIQVHGAENIPDHGPLLVLSNHPGAYDALIIYSNLQGHRVKSVSSEIPFLRNLPNTGQHFLFAPRDNSRERMIVLRNSVQHLQEGGTLNFFGTGHRDPDPSVYPGAENAIDHWLEVFDIFFRYVDGLKILPIIISGVISPKWAKHPITWLRRKQIDKQRLAEYGQVINQIRNPGRLYLEPRISIGEPYTEESLRESYGLVGLHQAVIERSKALYRESRAYFGGFFE
jgi:hypothetical protein